MTDNDVGLTVSDNNVGAAISINHTCLLEEANNAYLSLVSTFNDKVINASCLLDKTNETSRIYCGLLDGCSMMLVSRLFISRSTIVVLRSLHYQN